MTALTLGKKMLRVEDGMRGIVSLYSRTMEEEPRLSIQYIDRGELRQSGPKEIWVESDPGRLPLRDEEIQEVAAVADHWLRCIEQHLPRYAWEPINAPPGHRLPHDAGLVASIVEYLKGRV